MSQQAMITCNEESTRLEMDSIQSKLKLNMIQDAVIQCHRFLQIPVDCYVISDCELILENVISVAREFRLKSRFGEAISLIRWAARFCRYLEAPDIKLEFIEKLSLAAFEVSNALWLKNMKIAVEGEVIPLMRSFAVAIEITQIDDDLRKAELQAWNLYRLGMCYKQIGDYGQVLKTSELATGLLRQAYGSKPNCSHLMELCQRLTANSNSYWW
ncbi:unnamed protein product [Clavelina lepadiformis]|uniref:Uncharacterized protein n=1 Tax=Clavelina lepadiformis TaxID=159417 RepID=A0ABP0GXK7_CLALP